MKTPHRPTEIPEDRPLTNMEIELIEWLLNHGKSSAIKHLLSLSDTKIIRKCGCGCASIDFTVNGKEPPQNAGMDVVSDYIWRTNKGNLCGCFLFTVGDQLAGLEVWSIDGKETPISLPSTKDLEPWEVDK